MKGRIVCWMQGHRAGNAMYERRYINWPPDPHWTYIWAGARCIRCQTWITR